MKRQQGIKGFTLTDLLIIIAIVGFLLWVLLPKTTGNRVKATSITCTNNLKQIGIAHSIWAIDHQNKFPTELPVAYGGVMEAAVTGGVARVFQAMSKELTTPRILFCPTDKIRLKATTFDATKPINPATGTIPFLGNSNVSYFVGLDATTNKPSAFLAGDDNMQIGGASPQSSVLSLMSNTPVGWNKTRHEKMGTIGLVDTSVQRWSTKGLQNALQYTGLATNQLAMP